MQRSLDTPYNYYNSENIETDKRKTAEIITNEQKIRNYIKTHDNITQRKTGRSFLNEQYCKLQTGPQCMKIDAQGHEVTDYEYHAICGGCGKDFGAGPAGAQAALEHTMMDFNDGCSNYYADEIAVGSHWEETSPAYDECSICGKR